ncbi:MAG TPA: GntR family transcriptional regulator [Planctomycetota bacterium]|nr:GntR family transcriptional regulator [Planctomycetota bacterium]
MDVELNSTQQVKGRNLTNLVMRLRSRLTSGYYPQGGFLPPTRELASELDVSAETVRRGLKILEGDGLLVGEPRAGFRIVTEKDARRLRPIAFVTRNVGEDPSAVQPVSLALALAIRSEVAALGGSVQGINCRELLDAGVAERLAGGGFWGVVLETWDAGLLGEVLKADFPTVMVNSWFEDAEVDVVIQDNYRGGFLAARHVLGRGRRTVAWLGPLGGFAHARERFAGACAALGAEGLRIADGHVATVVAPEGDAAAAAAATLAAARGLLSGSPRPDAVLAFGPAGPLAVREAARELGLVIGRDFDLVAWVVEECYDLHLRSLFPVGAVPPAVTWNAGLMARRALRVFVERSENRGTEPVRVCVPTRLKFEPGVPAPVQPS